MKIYVRDGLARMEGHSRSDTVIRLEMPRDGKPGIMVTHAKGTRGWVGRGEPWAYFPASYTVVTFTEYRTSDDGKGHAIERASHTTFNQTPEK